MHVSYNFEGIPNHISAYLPNSLLHMSTYYNLPISKFEEEWGQCVKILKTEVFKLSHNFPPKDLKGLISTLNEHTRYSDFAVEGSTTDYELYTEVIIQ